MAAPKGHPKYGGRTKGTPNKKTQSLFDKCEAHGFDPFEALLEMAQENIDPQIKLGALKEVCSYLYPKRKAIEHSGLTDPKILDELEKLSQLSEDELREVAKEELKK